jgi:hypothetical protein
MMVASIVEHVISKNPEGGFIYFDKTEEAWYKVEKKQAHTKVVSMFKKFKKSQDKPSSMAATVASKHPAIKTTAKSGIASTALPTASTSKPCAVQKTEKPIGWIADGATFESAETPVSAVTPGAGGGSLSAASSVEPNETAWEEMMQRLGKASREAIDEPTAPNPIRK